MFLPSLPRFCHVNLPATRLIVLGAACRYPPCLARTLIDLLGTLVPRLCFLVPLSPPLPLHMAALLLLLRLQAPCLPLPLPLDLPRSTTRCSGDHILPRSHLRRTTPQLVRIGLVPEAFHRFRLGSRQNLALCLAHRHLRRNILTNLAPLILHPRFPQQRPLTTNRVG